MNLWLRLIWLFVTSRFRPRLELPGDASELTLRVLLNDLDISLHMNNGRYLAIMDLGRLDLLLRSPLGRAVWQHGWTPVASAVLIRFRRELRSFARYRLETRVVAWGADSVLIAQTFVFADGAHKGQTAARALVKGGLYDRKARRYVPMAELMRLVGVSGDSPPPSAETEAFLAADGAMREASRTRSPDSDENF
ncbi:thioesterase family protein [Hyphomicrobium sp. CS1GBMeth3]|uniref:thioesterase family protein n=1 Tax=Hyphomicrobium sp. CS1GBMeth3 TaxID=1892845 RepID=UPI000930E350|nr:thioesterase family protein [Hyphomicrobium sp. CS1GBMeth3]